jgi:D-alanyl-D-alanine carboxypeptidase
VGALPSNGAAQTEELTAALQARLDRFVTAPGIPGATLGVALDDGTSFALSAGLADTARAEPMPTDGLMLQGSVGKTYFGAVALQLVAEGRLELDRPVAETFPSAGWVDRLPNGRRVTLRHLMGHTSGIVRYELNPAFLEDLRADPYRSYTPEERLAYLFDTEAPFPPGEGWDYSDTNYILVAMLIEQVTGGSAYEEVRRRLLDPLGLNATVPSDRPGIPGLVQGYAGPANPFGAFDATLADGSLRFNPQFEWGGGGFASTAEDLAVWTRAVQTGRAFPAQLMDAYREGTPAPLGPQASYGLGVIMMTLPAGRAWGHSGFMPGYRTEAYYFPDHGVALALQVNTADPRAYAEPPLRVLSELAEILVEHGASGTGSGTGSTVESSPTRSLPGLVRLAARLH